MTTATTWDVLLRPILDDLLSRKGIRHAIIAVERGDGSTRWVGAGGDADGRGTPMTEDTPIFLASVTKTYTAAVVLRLVERGEFGLDDPITAHLPPTITDGLHVRSGTDHSGSITVRHLLANTSGLANYFEDRPKGGRSLAEELFTGGDRSWTTEDVAQRVRERLRAHFPPGGGVRYSDTNYQLLDAIIEAVTHRSVAEVFRDELFQPLGLRSTYLAGHAPEDPPAGVPAALFYEGRPIHLPLAMRSIGGQGGLVATVADAITFGRALFGGRVFRDASTLALMTDRWNRFGLPLDAAAIRSPSWPIEYGLGIMRFRLPRIFNGMRPMPAVLGHTGSSGSWLFHCPERDLYLAGTVDEVTSGAVPYRLVPKVLRALA
jgi:D-alanyl-D-alanine carboxypeptidase